MLTHDDARVDDELRAFPGRADNLEAPADYETGPGSIVPRERVEAALATATWFVDVIAGLLA
jgi:hypothetical protein